MEDGHVYCRRFWVVTGIACPTVGHRKVTKSYRCDGQVRRPNRGRHIKSEVKGNSWGNSSNDN